MYEQLSTAAWLARQHAHLIGKTAVGAAVMSSEGNIYSGCNVEHRFRAHDVHAEVNALTNMIGDGDANARVMFIVAERDKFTPCGGCLDWIFELGSGDTVVCFQGTPGGHIDVFHADDLMPHYPR